MSLQIWLVYVATVTAASLTPGPAVLLTMATGLRHGTLRSIPTIVGILAGNVVHIAISVAGLGAVMATSALLFNGLKWAGAAFLVYLGVKTILARRPAAAAASPDVALPSGAGPRSLFLRGFVSQIANPKAVIFYTALFPQFLTPGGHVVLESLLLASTEVAVEFAALLGFAALAAQGSRLGPRFATVTDKVSGGLLVGAGIGLAALRRN